MKKFTTDEKERTCGRFSHHNGAYTESSLEQRVRALEDADRFRIYFRALEKLRRAGGVPDSKSGLYHARIFLLSRARVQVHHGYPGLTRVSKPEIPYIACVYNARPREGDLKLLGLH
ncbi:hypothetical protein PoB_005645800 [Plakobranchus ocellatus]|uniref:Uncharacterized protein n=1 Tax=Plakobranchus ocellatus TaxID=259542 RepID=A0AAV4CG27_9GAST|nr:hypothetical protein PoB_005645800 [Plakobranchus ocellatus]